MGMDAFAGSSRNEAPYAWLWQDLKLADVSFEITFGAPQHLVVAALPSVDKATATASASPHRDSHSDAASSAVETNDVAAHPCSTKVYHLHSQVISSNSAFMRASLTSECGSAKRKRDSENDSFKWHLSARLEAQEAGVVEDVLRFFYTQELDNASTGLDLLMIMKVCSFLRRSPLFMQLQVILVCQKNIDQRFPFVDDKQKQGQHLIRFPCSPFHKACLYISLNCHRVTLMVCSGGPAHVS